MILDPMIFLACLIWFQSGLHSEVCEIDHKLHAIIAGRKRNVLQTIQEETATNIYYPSPLQDLMGPDLTTASSTGARNSNVIWITGEFFGVQRARDMLFQVSVNKVCLMCRSYSCRKLITIILDQVSYLKRHGYSSSQVGLDGH